MQKWIAVINIVLLAGLIILCVKGKMRWVAFFYLLLFSLMAFVTGFVDMYAMPGDFIIEGESVPYVPLSVAFLILTMAFLALKYGKHPGGHANRHPSRLRWIWLAGCVVLQMTALLFLLSAIYSYPMLGSDRPLPGIGVITYVLFSIVVAALLYFSSGMNTSNHPNLLRWAVLFYSISAFGTVMPVGLMLVYAVSIEPPTAFPLWADILTVSYIPYSILMVVLAKDYV